VLADPLKVNVTTLPVFREVVLETHFPPFSSWNLRVGTPGLVAARLKELFVFSGSLSRSPISSVLAADSSRRIGLKLACVPIVLWHLS